MTQEKNEFLEMPINSSGYLMSNFLKDENPFEELDNEIQNSLYYYP